MEPAAPCSLSAQGQQSGKSDVPLLRNVKQMELLVYNSVHYCEHVMLTSGHVHQMVQDRLRTGWDLLKHQPTLSLFYWFYLLCGNARGTALTALILKVQFAASQQTQHFQLTHCWLLIHAVMVLDGIWLFLQVRPSHVVSALQLGETCLMSTCAELSEASEQSEMVELEFTRRRRGSAEEHLIKGIIW